jgi:hypothetical protein
MNMQEQREVKQFKNFTRVEIQSVDINPLQGNAATVIGHYGKECSIVILDAPPSGYDKGIVIHNDCLIEIVE